MPMVTDSVPPPPMAGPMPDTRIIAPASWTERLDLDAEFGTSGPLEVDLGCGKGRFLLARAQAHPEARLLGVERLLKRLRKVDRKARRLGLHNVRLLRIESSYAIQYMLPPLSVTAFYLFFPDPWPKRRHHRRRVCTADFLAAVHAALVPQGVFHVATDDAGYFGAIEELLCADARFAPIPAYERPPEERTDFELIFLGQGLPIQQCSVRKV